MQNKFAAITMIMILMVGMTGLAAATNEDVIVSIGDGTGDVTIPIIVENVTNLGVCHVLLTYDKDVVSVTNVANGDMDATFPNYPANSGTVTIIAYAVGGIGDASNVTVANVTFASAQQCSINTSELNLSVQILNEATNDQSAGVIAHTIANGVYTSGYTGELNGDANGDNKVDAYDVLYIASYALNTPDFDIACPAIADVDGNGVVTLNDAAYLANHLLDPEGYPLL